MNEDILKNRKHTLIILYDNMMIGGIEKYLINLVHFSRKMNYRIIWVSPQNRQVADEFKDVLLDGYVEIINVNKTLWHWFDCENINFHKDEKVTIVSFTMFDLFRAEELKRKYLHVCEINNFFMMPHFTGKLYFIERYFKGCTKRMVYKFMQKIIAKLIKNDNIRFFSKEHIESLSNNYKVTIENNKGKVMDQYMDIPKFDLKNAELRSKREKFNIITVGRFQFPHKGYIIGLVRSYAKLKNEYPNLYLKIIGYGDDEKVLIDELEKLNEEQRTGIELVGKVSPLKLGEYFKEMHLNIGVAGAIYDGSYNGVISIPARHYTYDCEVYGFLPESKEYTISSEPGQAVEDYIRKVINMNDDMFIEYCKKSYDTFVSQAECNPNYIFDQHNSDVNRVLDKLDFFMIRIIYFMLKAKLKLCRVLNIKVDSGL